MFIEKLNRKRNGTYTIEEQKQISNGVWEGILDHDNIVADTISIYTGPKFTGDKIDNFIISTPSETPWKTYIRIFADVDIVYITYESLGDQVEADDINLLQDELVNEINRSKDVESRLDVKINTETNRAKNIESNLDNKIDVEIQRSTTADATMDNKIDNEITRSTNMDNTLNSKINSEIERSQNAENTLDTKIAQEMNRAKNQEQVLQSNITAEVSRSKKAEEDLNITIGNEKTRAVSRETEIENNLNTHIDNYNLEIQRLDRVDAQLENNKADKIYVNAELDKKYNKDQVFTKEEVLQKIQDIIGTAPDALDTLEELARALDNDPNFATNIVNLLSTKVDKVDGKQLSANDFTDSLKAKLDGIDDGANKYIHPDKHNASMIVENSTKRFVSDIEKAGWNAKETPSGAQAKADTAEDNAKAYTDVHDNNTIKHITATERTNWNDANLKKHTHSNKSILDGITQTLVDAWNSAVEHAKDTVRHITSAERTKWNSKAEGIHEHTKGEITDFPTSMTPEYTAIPSNADLNNYTEIGFYGTASSSVGSTVLNKPSEATGFTLIVSKRGNYTTQILVDWILDSPYMWIRSYSAGWGNWHKVPFEKDIPTKLSQLTKDINFDERYYTESEVDNKLNSKVDKVSGKGLSTEDYTTAEKNKLSGIEAGANKYIHPSTHPASMITESTTKRFVSDTEKANWNAKAEKSDIPTKVGQLENDKNYVTSAELGSAGYGDMMKSTYDKDNDGVVDKARVADSVDWTNVQNKPNVTNNDIQLGSYKLVYNSTTNSLDVEVVA